MLQQDVAILLQEAHDTDANGAQSGDTNAQSASRRVFNSHSPTLRKVVTGLNQ
jgi:hypothetical protein